MPIENESTTTGMMIKGSIEYEVVVHEYDNIERDGQGNVIFYEHFVEELSRTELIKLPFTDDKQFINFATDQWGWVIPHSNQGQFVWRMTPPNGPGTYKFYLAFASDNLGNLVDCDIRIGSWNFQEGLDVDKYLPTTPIFQLNCSEVNMPLKTSTPVFTVDKRVEMLVIRFRKTSNSGTGNFYILAGMLIKQ